MKVQPGITISAAALFASFVLFAPAKAAITQTPTQDTPTQQTPSVISAEEQEQAAKAAHEAAEAQEHAAKAAEEAAEEQERAAAHAAHEAAEAQERAAQAAHEAQEEQERAAAKAAHEAEEQQLRAERSYPAERRTPVTVVGCVIPEREWRRAHNQGNGGVMRTGAGLKNEYILVHASIITPDKPEPVAKSCDRDAGGEAYEMTGKGEGSLRSFVSTGRQVEITGMFKRAEITRGTRGTNHPQPTGGGTMFWGQDLRLFEINVATARDYVPPVAAAPTIVIVPRAAVTPPAAEPEPKPEEPAPAATTGREELPKTASSMPLVALLGALFIGAAFALRAFRGISGRVNM